MEDDSNTAAPLAAQGDPVASPRVLRARNTPLPRFSRARNTQWLARYRVQLAGLGVALCGILIFTLPLYAKLPRTCPADTIDMRGECLWFANFGARYCDAAALCAQRGASLPTLENKHTHHLIRKMSAYHWTAFHGNGSFTLEIGGETLAFETPRHPHAVRLNMYRVEAVPVTDKAFVMCVSNK